MKKEENTLLLEQIIKRLEEIQEAEIISRKIAKILFQLILAATLYLSYCFISLSLDRNAFIQNYRPALILLIAAVSIGIRQNISRYRREKRLQRFPVSEIKTMVEIKKVPDLVISPPGEDPYAKFIRKNLRKRKAYDERTLRILVFILILINSKYISKIRDELALIFLIEALRDRLISEIESLEDGQRNEYLQELSAFEEFFANLS